MKACLEGVGFDIDANLTHLINAAVTVVWVKT
jgi:hypothetical protein